MLASFTTRWAPFDKTQERLTGKGVKRFCLYWHHLNQEQALTSNGLEEFTCCVPLPASPSRCCHVGICTRKRPDAHSRTRGREGKGHVCVGGALDEIKIWWSMKPGLMESQRTFCFLVFPRRNSIPYRTSHCLSHAILCPITPLGNTITQQVSWITTDNYLY